MAVVWMEPATPFGGHVRKAKRSVSISPPFSSQTDLQFGVQIPANTAGGRVSSNANQVSPRFLPSSPARLSNSLDVLETLEGDCTEHSMLFIGLARALGLPAKEIAGLI